MHRRSFLGAAGASLGAASLWPSVARAATAGDRKLIFVFAQGGWDPTRVFADGFDHAGVDMDAGAERAQVGGLRFVDHPDRPSVRAFFEAHAARTVVFDGVMVRSIAHDICTIIAMTGDTSGRVPDWPAIVGAADMGRYTLPHLVLGGPSFPGDLGAAVARTGGAGQLEALLSGKALTYADLPVDGPSSPARSLLDRYLARRAAARADAARSSAEARLTGDYAAALAKASALEDLRWTMDFTGGAALEDQAMVAVEALSLGISRCVTLGTGAAFGWDTHANNDAQQSPLWEATFAGLTQLMSMLQATPGETEPTLADETLVVVLSEMGRTPALNAFQGKDHWPYTSLMLVGAGLDGGRTIGGWDANWYGRPVDPASGEVSEHGQVLSAEAVGATLLALTDVDPDAHVRGVSPITGVIA